MEGSCPRLPTQGTKGASLTITIRRTHCIPPISHPHRPIPLPHLPAPPPSFPFHPQRDWDATVQELVHQRQQEHWGLRGGGRWEVGGQLCHQGRVKSVPRGRRPRILCRASPKDRTRAHPLISSWPHRTVWYQPCRSSAHRNPSSSFSCPSDRHAQK